MTIEIDVVGAIVGSLAGIIGGLSALSMFFWKYFIKPKVVEEIKKNVDMEAVVKRLDGHDKDIAELRETNIMLAKLLERTVESNKYILKGVFACLDGLDQLNCNGNVSLVYKDIQNYLIQREESGFIVKEK